MAIPKANPDSLSTAPAITRTTNHGRWSMSDEKAEEAVWAWIIIATDNNWAAAWQNEIF